MLLVLGAWLGCGGHPDAGLGEYPLLSGTIDGWTTVDGPADLRARAGPFSPNGPTELHLLATGGLGYRQVHEHRTSSPVKPACASVSSAASTSSIRCR
jgi:hypothetical protein